MLLLLFACNGAADHERRATSAGPEYNEEGLLIIRSDVNRDGTPDVHKYYDEEQDESSGALTRTLVRTEVDLNSDGVINLVRRYDEFGDILREEIDGNLDGEVDVIVYWEEGVQARRELDSDHDGTFDEYRYYHGGYLHRVERDTDGDGTLDMWSYYDRHGLARVGHDLNEDGEPDSWMQRPE